MDCISTQDLTTGMTNIKKIICSSALLLASTSVAISLSSSTGWASTHLQDSVVLAKEENSDTVRQGLPGRRLGGGTRSGGIFSHDNAYLTALVAPTDLGITTAPHPSFMFYVPEMVGDQIVEFVLRDDRDELVYETSFRVEKAGGIINIETADKITALDLNESYRWYFSIIPELSDRSNDVVVDGTIQRVDPADWFAQQDVDASLLEQTSEHNPLMHARLLHKKADLWHDAAIALSGLLQTDPNDAALSSEWHYLLETAGLATMPEVYRPAVRLCLN